MTNEKEQGLKQLACKVRKCIIEGVYNAKSGHPGGSLSIADTITYIYEYVLKYDPKNPKWEDRDRLVLSKGHCAPALYSILALEGFFPESEIKTLRHTGAMLQGHPDMKGTPGVDMSSGSLGQGISAACGMALSAKKFNKDYRVYAILGDGELEEGMVWEAAMFASHYKLDNLCAVVDYNNLQIDGRLNEVCSPEPIPEKFAAFGFNVILINAHDFNELEEAFTKAAQTKGKPTVIIQKSIKGKGVSFMEDNVSWHGSAPNKEQYDLAMTELDAELKKLGGNK